jgi:hypothetical protein
MFQIKPRNAAEPDRKCGMFTAFVLRCKKPTDRREAFEFIQNLSIDMAFSGNGRHIANAGVDHI